MPLSHIFHDNSFSLLKLRLWQLLVFGSGALLFTAILVERIVTLRTPELLQLARNSPHPLASATYQAPRNKNPSAADNTLSSAFFAVFAHPEDNLAFAQKLDFTLSSLLEELQGNETGGESSKPDEPHSGDDFTFDTITPEETIPDEGTPSQDPVRIFAEEIVGGRFLTFSGALKLNLPYLNKMGLGLFQAIGLEQKLVGRYVTHIFPSKVQAYFDSHSKGSIFWSAQKDPITGIHHAVVTLTSHDIDAILDGFCAEEQPSPICHVLGLDSTRSLETLAQGLEFLGEEFEMRIDVFWSLKGTTFMWSTNQEWIKNILAPHEEHLYSLSSSTKGKDTSILEVGFSPHGAFHNQKSTHLLSPSDHNETFSIGLDVSQLYDSFHYLLAVLKQRDENQETPLLAYMQLPKNEERFTEWDDDLNRQSQRFEKFILRWTKELNDFLPELWFGDVEHSFLSNKMPTIGTNGKAFLAEILKENKLISSLSTISTLNKIPRLKATQFQEWIRLSTELNATEFANIWNQLLSSMVKDTQRKPDTEKNKL